MNADERINLHELLDRFATDEPARERLQDAMGDFRDELQRAIEHKGPVHIDHLLAQFLREVITSAWGVPVESIWPHAPGEHPGGERRALFENFLGDIDLSQLENRRDGS